MLSYQVSEHRKVPKVSQHRGDGSGIKVERQSENRHSLVSAGFAKEQRKSRVASVATCAALDLCCSEAIMERSECPFVLNKQVPSCRLHDVVTLIDLHDVVNFVR